MVFEKTLESPLDCNEIKPVNPKWNKYWIFIKRIDTEAQAPVLLPPDMKRWLIRKDPDAGKYSRQEEKGWQKTRWLDGITDSMDLSLSKLWDGEGQGSLVYCSPLGCKESDMTEWLNSNSNSCLELIHMPAVTLKEEFIYCFHS